MAVLHLYISAGHNYRGHHDREPGTHPLQEVDAVECVAGAGLVGDRYFQHAENYKGQITFFAMEVHRQLCEQFGQPNTPPAVYRRNVITAGVDLNGLIGQEFEIQGIRFAGVEECRPCYWMNRAVAAGAEDAMKGRGGLRARILKGGMLRRDA